MRKLGRSIVLLASFPRSGNTWMRFILANIFKNDDRQVNFKNIRDYMPTGYNDDLDTTDGLIKESYPFVIKSHSKYYDIKKTPDKAIYISRKKIDVLKSYWFFLEQENPNLFKCLEDFVRCYRFKYGSWEDHVDSWLNDVDENIKLLNINYEDMRKDIVGVVKKCTSHMNVSVSEGKIKKAVEKCEYEKMKRMEKSKVTKASHKKELKTLLGLAQQVRSISNTRLDFYRYLFLRAWSKLIRVVTL